MKNVTVSVGDALYRQARAKAAGEGKSLSAIVRAALERYAAGQTWHAHVKDRNRRIDLLLKKTKHFRLGRMPNRENAMRAEAFVDTNILVYAIEGSELSKGRPDLALSVQVLNEFYRTVTSPRRKQPLMHAETLAWLEVWKRFPVQDFTLRIHEEGVITRARYQIGIYDAMIVAAARALGCRIIFSEDLSDGQNYGGVVAIA